MQLQPLNPSGTSHKVSERERERAAVEERRREGGKEVVKRKLRFGQNCLFSKKSGRAGGEGSEVRLATVS